MYISSAHHLSEAVEVFNSLVSQQDAVSAKSLFSLSVSQKSLSSKLDDHDFNLLLLWQTRHVFCQFLPPILPPGLPLCPLRAWGFTWILQFSRLPSNGGLAWIHQRAPIVPCALHHLGHHAVTCKYGGDVVSRHNRIRDILVETCRQVHIGVKVETNWE